jgi:hypothetical protein
MAARRLKAEKWRGIDVAGQISAKAANAPPCTVVQKRFHDGDVFCLVCGNSRAVGLRPFELAC